MTMPEPHYTFDFEGISDHLYNSRLHITNHREGRTVTIHVSVDDSDFLRLRGLQVNSHVADLIDLAVAIYEADRWSLRDSESPCVIRVRLPIRHLSTFQRFELHRQLQEMLYWFTGDYWIFEFTALSEQRRFAELQRPLWKSSNEDVRAEVALWSGGLDAFAGLCNRIRDDVADRFLLLGAGGNPSIRGVQQRVFHLLHSRLNMDLHLMQLHIYQKDTKKNGLRPDTKLRARGLVFMLMGCVYARLEGQHKLALYENGIGAINLPFRASEVGLDHARSVHPLSLLAVSKLVSFILEEQFLVHNPFVGWTKAEMCTILKELEVTDIAWQTFSCDRPHRKDNPQCGRCSSCLLRRESLLASKTPDETKYLIHVESGNTLYRLLRKSHLPHMMYQVNTIQSLLESGDAWGEFAREHPSRLGDLVDRLSYETGAYREILIEEVLSLYQRYAEEWSLGNVKAVFEPEITDIIRASKHKNQPKAISHEGMPK
jgi:7-cyano-7-deazaguanine synthase in queuosine biosynthesis